ncbi:MAG TPA: hypothetical protein VK508_14255 [Cyclobacteriaceae bacterium]|nr:hypothetical protein [Cyclobacteriaceae bacterium]
MKSVSLALLFWMVTAACFAQEPTHPDTVRAGVYIISVHDINFRDKEYTLRFWLWFIYDNPEFDFTKQLDLPNAKDIVIQQTIYDSLDGKTWAIMKMKATMKQNWNVHDFPFDQQRLKMHIENTLFDKRRLIFVPDTVGSSLDPKDAIDGWNVSEFSVAESANDYLTGFGDASSNNQNFSSFDVFIGLDRSALGMFFKIFLGMYIAFMIATISFTPHPSEMEPRFGLPVGGLFAAVGNKYIIDSLLPESSAFTLVDSLHALTFIGIFGILLVSAIALRQYDSGKKALAEQTNRRGARFVITAYVIGNMIFVGLAAT